MSLRGRADSSVSALAQPDLDPLATQERLQRQEQELRGCIMAFAAADRLSREELHSREQ
ncbi:MAG: hypothetical protein JNM66_27195 [Bryobacterales bacterium]|nr:hypothetical protein [Bryobacterales bacterium]